MMQSTTTPTNSCPGVMFSTFVVERLRELGLWAGSDWFDSMVTIHGEHRCHLHWRMGLTPDQSAEELRVFAQVAMKKQKLVPVEIPADASTPIRHTFRAINAARRNGFMV